MSSILSEKNLELSPLKPNFWGVFQNFQWMSFISLQTNIQFCSLIWMCLCPVTFCIRVTSLEIFYAESTENLSSFVLFTVSKRCTASSHKQQNMRTRIRVAGSANGPTEWLRILFLLQDSAYIVVMVIIETTATFLVDNAVITSSAFHKVEFLNFILFPTVKEFWKSVYNWHHLFWDTVCRPIQLQNMRTCGGTDKVDDDVFSPRRSPLSRDFTDMHYGLWMVDIDVKYRRVDYTCDVRAVRRRSTEARVCREPDLLTRPSLLHVDTTNVWGNSVAWRSLSGSNQRQTGQLNGCVYLAPYI